MAQKYSISFKIVKVYSLNEREDDVFFVLLSFFRRSTLAALAHLREHCHLADGEDTLSRQKKK